MNTKRTLKWGLVTAAATCVVVAAAGCELLVDFDRSKIPSEGGTEDVTTPDGPVSETGGETSTDAPSESSMGDAGDAASETTTTEGGMDGSEGGDASDGAMGMAIFGLGPPASLNFGTVAQGTTTAAYTFTVTNSGTGSGTPTITKGGNNAADFTATGCASAVAPAGTCILSVTFAPGGTGARVGTISVGTGTPTSLAGNGVAAGTLTISPTTQSFGSVTSGSSSAEFSFTVTNTDAVNDVSLGTPTVDGQDSAVFLVDADGGGGQCSGGLAASATCTLLLHFTPSGTGFRYASLSIAGAATDGGSAPGTASSSLTGTGQ